MEQLKDYALVVGINKYRVTAPVVSVKEARGIEAGRQFINGEVEHGGKR